MDEEELLSELRRILEQERRYASFFQHPDVRVKEVGVVRTLISALPNAFPIPASAVQACKDDPPDCVAVADDARVWAFEVTELVDQAVLEWTINAQREGGDPSGWAAWDRQKLIYWLSGIVARKGTSSQVDRGAYDEYVLVVHTAEPGLVAADAAEWLRDAELGSFGVISRGYLLFEYLPQRGYVALPLPSSLDPQRG